MDSDVICEFPKFHVFPDRRYGTRTDPVKCENCDFIWIWCPKCSHEKIVGHQYRSFEDFQDFEKDHLSHSQYNFIQDPEAEKGLLDSMSNYFNEGDDDG